MRLCRLPTYPTTTSGPSGDRARDHFRCSHSSRSWAPNAAESMPGEGLLRLQAANVDLGAAEAEARADARAGHFVRFRVQDTGPGIAEEALQRVFERFYRADEARAGGGSGLGLAIVKLLVTLHGGQVEARNHPEGGAVLTVSLPRQPLGP